MKLFTLFLNRCERITIFRNSFRFLVELGLQSTLSSLWGLYLTHDTFPGLGSLNCNWLVSVQVVDDLPVLDGLVKKGTRSYVLYFLFRHNSFIILLLT